MFIPRELGIHKCGKCKDGLLDKDFLRCGILLSGDSKYQPFFIYLCPHCKHKGSYRIKRKDKDLPGDMFRQFGNALDAMYFRDSKIDTPSIDDFLIDP